MSLVETLRGVDDDEFVETPALLVAAICFLGAWTYCAVGFGTLGLAIGWLPSLVFAAFIREAFVIVRPLFAVSVFVALLAGGWFFTQY